MARKSDDSKSAASSEYSSRSGSSRSGGSASRGFSSSRSGSKSPRGRRRSRSRSESRSWSRSRSGSRSMSRSRSRSVSPRGRFRRRPGRRRSDSRSSRSKSMSRSSRSFSRSPVRRRGRRGSRSISSDRNFGRGRRWRGARDRSDSRARRREMMLERRKKQEEKESRQIAVEGFEESLKKEHIEEIFSFFGKVQDTYRDVILAPSVKPNREDPDDRLDAFVIEFEALAEAEDALQHMDGGEIGGKSLAVSKQKDFKFKRSVERRARMSVRNEPDPQGRGVRLEGPRFESPRVGRGRRPPERRLGSPPWRDRRPGGRGGRMSSLSPPGRRFSPRGRFVPRRGDGRGRGRGERLGPRGSNERDFNPRGSKESGFGSENRDRRPRLRNRDSRDRSTSPMRDRQT
ncbi:hypothetical protein NDN08_000679 [Rhodosorus marinus]|uniref:RRM domain-containing protein n=1 Tax=Rhodosorus marinus TaxID=101924 RepID=A0AAV8USP4_9RHOD|nr:hypothetical protein NDN08_000679 [Rhodosorus marinus]